MQPVKSVFGLVGAAVPVLWAGGLAYYFHGTNQAMGGVATKELGPTIIGLSVIAGLFAIPLLIRIVRIFVGASSQAASPKLAGVDEPEVSDFDADAALARYLARKEAGQLDAVPLSQASPSAAMRTGFGRKPA